MVYITIVAYKSKVMRLKKMTKTILKALIDKNMTRKELASRIERSRVYTSNVINCRFSNPPIETISRIARVLDLSIDDLVSNGNYHNKAA